MMASQTSRQRGSTVTKVLGKIAAAASRIAKMTRRRKSQRRTQKKTQHRLKSKTRRQRTDQRQQGVRVDQEKTRQPEMARRRKVNKRSVETVRRKMQEALTAKARQNPTKSSKIRNSSHRSL